MRIVSLLAGGTELVCALGRGESLVGRSHECDDPPWVRRLPVLSGPTFDVTGSSIDIDRLVREKLRAGQPLYTIDQQRLHDLAPDLVITQVHCDVCAVGPGEVADAHAWPGLQNLQTVSMRGGSLDGILDDFQVVANAAGATAQGEDLVISLRAQRRAWQAWAAARPRPRVLCLEWTDPPFPMGNWGPELVDLAGGECLLGNRNGHSAAVPWQAVLHADPDVLVIAPCGFDLGRALIDVSKLAEHPGWSDLKAVRSGRVYVSDGNRYFNRSGPSVFATVALLAEMIHPGVTPAVSAPTVSQLYRRLND